MIRNVIFDLGNVLVPFDWRIAVKRMVKYLPPDIGKEADLDPRTLAKVISDLVDKLEIGTISFAEFHRLVVMRVGLTADLEEFQDIWTAIFEVDSNMTRLGRSLTRRYDVWLASNTDEVHYNYIITRFPEVLFFKKAALSYKMGAKKPDQEYFLKAIEIFGIQPERSVFIDDLEANVEAATRTGIIGIQFTTYEDLKDDLEKIGIDISSV